MSRLHDKSTLKPSQAELRQLSDEVTRIATTLARFAAEPGADAKPRREPLADDGNGAKVAIETVRDAIRARQLRNQFFDDRLFADPAWDMLLHLFEAALAGVRVSATALYAASDLPAETALRWIETMVNAGLVRRCADPHDRSRQFVELSPKAGDAMRGYFSQVAEPESD